MIQRNEGEKGAVGKIETKTGGSRDVMTARRVKGKFATNENYGGNGQLDETPSKSKVNCAGSGFCRHQVFQTREYGARLVADSYPVDNSSTLPYSCRPGQSWRPQVITGQRLGQ